MAEVYNFEGHQIPHVGLSGDLGGVGNQANRAFNMRMSSFGMLRFGNRSSSDYTMILNQGKDAVELQNPEIPVWASDNDKNPYTTVSGVNARFRIKNDEFTIMGTGNRRSNTATDQPGLDVMDTTAAVDDGTNAPKRFPNEGWRTFGGRTTGHGYIVPGYEPI